MKYRKIPTRDFSTGTGIWVVSYDAKNRPASFRDVLTGTLVECAYDCRGRRCTKKVSVAGTAPRPLTFRHAEKGLMLFYAFDGNKNVSDVFFLALQNGIGAHYEYAPFGAVTRTSKATSSKVDLIGANPWRFSSEFYDPELDLVYYNYRHYSPALGRFLSRDPIQEEGGWNLYAFAENAPVVFIDKSGMFSFFPVRGPDFDVSPNASCCLEEKPLWKASGYGSLSECMQDNTNSTKYFGMTCSALCAVKNHLMKIAIGALYTGALVGDILGMNLICRKMICTKIKSPVKNIRRVRRPSGLVRYVYWSCPDKTGRG